MVATKADAMVERGAQRLHALSVAAARRGGMAGKLAQPLAEDAVFLRKLKPSLIKARIRGDAPKDETPQPVVGPTPTRPHGAAGWGQVFHVSRMEHERPDPTGGRKGPSPFAVIGGAAAAGLAAAKLIDWRGHAHPRR